MYFFFFQAEDGIRDDLVTGVQTCALPISLPQREKGSIKSGVLPQREMGSIKSGALPQREMGCIKSGALPQREMGSINSGGAAATRNGQIGRASCRERV